MKLFFSDTTFFLVNAAQASHTQGQDKHGIRSAPDSGSQDLQHGVVDRQIGAKDFGHAQQGADGSTSDSEKHHRY